MYVNQRFNAKDDGEGFLTAISVDHSTHLNFCITDTHKSYHGAAVTTTHASISASKATAIELRDLLNKLYPPEEELEIAVYPSHAPTDVIRIEAVDGVLLISGDNLKVFVEAEEI